MWLRDIAQLIHDTFGDQGYKITIRDMPDWALTLAAKLSKSARFISSTIGRKFTYDVTRVSERFKGASFHTEILQPLTNTPCR